MAEEGQAIDDRELMDAVRGGCRDSFALLYERHVGAASAYARRLVRQSADEHDIVSDAFLRVFAILSRGLGPQDSFRPYLLRAVRNAGYDRTRAERREDLTDELSVLESAEPFHDVAVERLDRDLVLTALRKLPTRWQEVLWLTLIEELPVDVAAKRLGVNANSLTSLAYRAREGLRRAYLQTSMSSSRSKACERVSGALVRFVRGTAAPTNRRMVEEHLGDCADCQDKIRQLHETEAQLWDRSVALVPMQHARGPRKAARAAGAARLGAPHPVAVPGSYCVSA